jgi:adenosylcobinamide-phosphate synthase
MIAHFSGGVLGVIGAVLIVYLVATTIAMRGLVDSARLVIRSVKEGNLVDARFHLSMIVGRDTGDLSEEKVLAAVMETLAENLSDGVVAPVFYFVLGGLPLAMTYKAINTLDSMVGYKNDSYINFGWAAARLDDIANYVPARLTGLLIVISAFLASLVSGGKGPMSVVCRSYRIMNRDGRNHTSPNSGIPEAAMAGAAGVRMGGVASYGGMVVEKPFIGDAETDDYMAASADVIRIVYIVSVLAIGIAAIILSSMRSGL